MSSKNFGPIVSGYLDPAARNWETTVFQSGKPVLDKELNLAEDLSNGISQELTQRLMPSGWMAPDLLDTCEDYLTLTSTPNTVQIPNDLVAHVNGWILKVANTNSESFNKIVFPDPPTGVGVQRTDLVILEVWRRLISPTSPDGKSPMGRIWRNGNVKITLDADPYTLEDDLYDTNVAQETTKRVQIQYRLRVIPGIDLAAYPSGLDDPNVVPHTVPSLAVDSDGSPVYGYAYVNQSGATPHGDAGLWVAGDGSLSAQADLGTVDGYMYAIPLMSMVRRNQSGFSRLDNHNGGVLAVAGTSDRPDSLFADVIVDKDYIDLRHGVDPTGWSYQEVLTRNMGLLLDNNLRTEFGTTLIGNGTFGHTVLMADEVGILPGDGIDTGDTPGANFIGQFDSVRRFFTDKANVEIVTLVFDRPGGGNWTDGDVVTIQPTSLPVYPYLPFNWASRADSHVTLLDVINMRWQGDALGKVTRSLDFSYPFVPYTVTGLSNIPLTTVDITFPDIPAGVTDEKLYVDLVIEYPAGLGLTRTPTQTFGNASVQFNNPSALPAGAFLDSEIDPAHREVRLQLQLPSTTHTVIWDHTCYVEGYVDKALLLPERAYALDSVLINGVPTVDTPSLTPDGRIVLLGADLFNTGDLVEVSYQPYRPIQEDTVQVTIYYDSRWPQTIREGFLPDTLIVIPRYIDNSLHTLTVGPASPDEAYPYPSAYVQLGGINPSSDGYFTGDHELACTAKIFTSEFNSNTGLLKLPIYVGYTPNANEVVFTRIPGSADSENRTFYPSVNTSFYIPNAYAQPISDDKRHRNFLGFVAELPTDTSFGKKGELVLVVIVREAMLDKNNYVAFDTDATQNTTSASVFHLKGRLLNKRV